MGKNCKEQELLAHKKSNATSCVSNKLIVFKISIGMKWYVSVMQFLETEGGGKSGKEFTVVTCSCEFVSVVYREGIIY